MNGNMVCDCLQWLAFLCYEFLGFLSSWSNPSVQRWSRKDNQVVQEIDLPSSSITLADSDFGKGRLSFGDIVVAEVTSFEKVWSTSDGGEGNKEVVFYKPVNLPEGFMCLGHHCQLNQAGVEVRILVAQASGENLQPALSSPVDYSLAWSHQDQNGNTNGPGYFWLPVAPEGYRSVGYVVTTSAEKPAIEDVMCVRADLTDVCKMTDSLWETNSPSNFKVCNLMPLTTRTGIPLGCFCCTTNMSSDTNPSIYCLKNSSLSSSGMPSLGELEMLIRKYGPVFVFHPKEKYFPSSVSWLFSNNVLLYSSNGTQPIVISPDGSNLPAGGTNDDKYWIDYPADTADGIKIGNLSSAEAYIHTKPMLGGTFTDLAIWLYYPFNGAATAKVEMVDLGLGKVGEHVSDWEHVTLRVSNFTGKLQKVFFSQHSHGAWIDATNVEYIDGNKFNVYSSKSGHASYPHPGLVLQGDHGVGIRNDTAKSNFILDCSKKYLIISAEYLGDGVAPPEPAWLQYMRKWGPKVQYDTREEIEKVIHNLPSFLRKKLRSLVSKLPAEVFGENGPTGPKEKASWFGDEKE